MKTLYNNLYEKDSQDNLYQAIYNKVKYLDSYLLGYTGAKSLAKDIFNYIIEKDYDIESIKDFDDFVDELMENTEFRETIWENVLEDVVEVLREDIKNITEHIDEDMYNKNYEFFVNYRDKTVIVEDYDIYEEIVQLFKKYNMDFSKKQIAQILTDIVKFENIPIYGHQDKIPGIVNLRVGTLTMDTDSGDFTYEFSNDIIEILQHLSDMDKEFIENFSFGKTISNVNLYDGTFDLVPENSIYTYYISFKDLDYYVQYFAIKNGFLDFKNKKRR